MRRPTSIKLRAAMILAGVAIGCGVVAVLNVRSWSMNRYLFDTESNRRRVADRLTQLGADYRRHPENTSLLQEIEDAARSSYWFERCAALSVLGELGSKAEPTLPTIVENLHSRFAIAAPDSCARDSAHKSYVKLTDESPPAPGRGDRRDF